MSARGSSATPRQGAFPHMNNPASRARHEDIEASLSSPAMTEDGRHRPFKRPRANSTSIAGSFSSAMNVKTPTRSYYQSNYHSAQAPPDTPHQGPLEVREDTASLANRAFAEGGEPASDDVILEVSEPVTPEEGDASVPDPLSSDRTEPQLLSSLPEPALAPAESSVFEDDFGAVTMDTAIISQPHEETPLIPKATSHHRQSSHRKIRESDGGWLQLDQKLDSIRRGTAKASEKISYFARLATSPKSWDKKAIFESTVTKPLGYLPAVVLGLLLNVLDALSYGMILFPLGQPIFADLGPDGLSIFYVSCIVSQLTYSLGGSRFRGAVGSEMIEVVPFFHKMAYTIMEEIGEDKPDAVRATTILAYASSSILTGLVFWTMGKGRLGVLIGFLPRHLLIGCIGGVGFFLVVTGIEVSARLDGSLDYNLATLNKLLEPDTLPLWTVPLALAISLMILKRWAKFALMDAAYFISIIAVFYIVVTAVPELELETLRTSGWVFEAPSSGAPWWHFYTLYNFSIVDWGALASTIPAMCALTFFGLLHVPINIPALAFTTGEDNVDIDRELKAHGYSNAISGLLGSIQNYLVYTNTILFMRSGGDSRVAGVLLAGATFGILWIGPVVIGYVPIMVVGALIFFLGFDLLKEAVYETFGRVNKLEYLTILIIVLTMGIYDFVVGILVGIALACVSLVLQTAQVSAIRGMLRGSTTSSMIRRHPTQARFLNAVGEQTYIMKLAGFLFFGTIVGVENTIRALLEEDAFNSEPMRFMVLDLTKVDGIDFSAAEAFARIHRLLLTRDVELLLCGFAVSSSVGQSLYNIGLLDGPESIEYHEDLNSALEACENQLLRAFYEQRDRLDRKRTAARALEVPQPTSAQILSDDLAPHSPRRGALHRAATTTLTSQEYTTRTQRWQHYPQPLSLILHTFADISVKDDEFWHRAVPFFVRQELPAGSVLYHSGDRPDYFYLLETGMLKAVYELEEGSFSEVIVAGSTCGELPFFSATKRTATVVADRDSVTWSLSTENWKNMQETETEVAIELLKVGLKLTSERFDAITRHMLLSS